MNDMLEIKTAYDNIDKLESKEVDLEKKFKAQQKKIDYEVELSKIKAQVRANKELKDINSQQNIIWDTRDELKLAYAAFDKSYGEEFGNL